MGDNHWLGKMLFPRSVQSLLENFARNNKDSKDVIAEERELNMKEIRNFIEAHGAKFTDAMTGFGYFQEALQVSNALEFYLTMLFRGSAKYLLPNTPGADIVLALILKD